MIDLIAIPARCHIGDVTIWVGTRQSHQQEYILRATECHEVLAIEIVEGTVCSIAGGCSQRTMGTHQIFQVMWHTWVVGKPLEGIHAMIGVEI